YLQIESRPAGAWWRRRRGRPGSSFSWTEPRMSERGSPMSDITRGCTNQDHQIEELKKDLHRLGEEVAKAVSCPGISDAVLALIAAIDYEDETLVESSLASLLAALAGVADNCIAKELKAADGVKSGLKEGWQKYIDKKAYDIAVFEEIKDKIESF